MRYSVSKYSMTLQTCKPCIVRRPRYGGPRGNVAILFVAEKLEWWGYLTVKNCLQSLKMASFDRPCTTFYLSAVVDIALSYTICELLKTLDNIVTSKSRLEVIQGHLNWYYSKAWVPFPIRLP